MYTPAVNTGLRNSLTASRLLQADVVATGVRVDGGLGSAFRVQICYNYAFSRATLKAVRS